MSRSVSGKSLKSRLKSSLRDLYVGFSILYQDDVFFFFSSILLLPLLSVDFSRLRLKGSRVPSGLGRGDIPASDGQPRRQGGGASGWEERDESDARSRDPWLSPTAVAFSEEASSDGTPAEVAVRSPSKHGDRAPSCGLWLGLDGDGHLTASFRLLCSDTWRVGEPSGFLFLRRRVRWPVDSALDAASGSADATTVAAIALTAGVVEGGAAAGLGRSRSDASAAGAGQAGADSSDGVAAGDVGCGGCNSVAAAAMRRGAAAAIAASAGCAMPQPPSPPLGAPSSPATTSTAAAPSGDGAAGGEERRLTPLISCAPPLELELRLREAWLLLLLSDDRSPPPP